MVGESDFTKAVQRLLVVTAQSRSDLIQSALTLVANLCAIARTELLCQDIEGAAAALQKARRIEALIRQRLDESRDIFDVELRARLQKVENEVAQLDGQLHRAAGPSGDDLSR